MINGQKEYAIKIANLADMLQMKKELEQKINSAEREILKYEAEKIQKKAPTVKTPAYWAWRI